MGAPTFKEQIAADISGTFLNCLDQLAEAMKNLRSGTGHISRLYRMVQAKH